MDNSVIAKSGWLSRQTTIMKKWKKNWVELYRNGHLKYYENDQSPNAEDVIMMPSECLSIKTGAQIKGVQPPQNQIAQSLFSVTSTNGKTWIFCGESLDDMRAWQLALEQARLLGYEQNIMGQTAPVYMQYGPLPTYHDTSVTYAAPGYPYNTQAGYYGYPYGTSQTILYNPNRYHRNNGANFGVGMLAGAALGSMMWAPLLWW